MRPSPVQNEALSPPQVAIRDLFADVNGIVAKIHESRHLKSPCNDHHKTIIEPSHLTVALGKSMPKVQILNSSIIYSAKFQETKNTSLAKHKPLKIECRLISLHQISATFLEHLAWLQTNMLRQRTFASGTRGMTAVKVIEGTG